MSETKSIFIHQSSYIKHIVERFNMLDANTRESRFKNMLSAISGERDANIDNIILQTSNR